ncbi:hypothetical protein V7S43_007392 [Phytophthora oleae]|uniref:Uncharacterized protein n=1 Tax=Phytophthora oleae TaxID=2107226 RepID=A0ABD3FN72_9STRA
MADDVVKILEGACLSSIYCLRESEGAVMVENMVGMVARDCMLNDTIMDFGMRCICESIGGCYVLDSFAPTMGCPPPPNSPISSYKCVVMAVHLSGIHWGGNYRLLYLQYFNTDNYAVFVRAALFFDVLRYNGVDLRKCGGWNFEEMARGFHARSGISCAREECVN